MNDMNLSHTKKRRTLANQYKTMRKMGQSPTTPDLMFQKESLPFELSEEKLVDKMMRK
jgi:hypothetical protein